MSSTSWTSEFSAVKTALRLDPEFFDYRSRSVTEALTQSGAVSLGSLVQDVRRGILPEYVNEGEVRVVKTASVRRFEFARSPEAFVSREFAAMNPRAEVPLNSIVVTSTGVGSAGRAFAHLIESGDDGLVADGHITVMQAPDSEAAAYITAFLQSPIGRQQILRHHRGSSRQIELYPQDICAVLIPSTSPRWKKSIAERWITAVTSVFESDNAISAAERLIADFIGIDADYAQKPIPVAASWTSSLSALRVATRLDAEHQNPRVAKLKRSIEEAGSIPLSSLAMSIRKGFQPAGYSENGETVVVKAKDVYYPDFSFGSCDRTWGTNWPYYLAGGELLINSTGEGTLGRSTVVPFVKPTGDQAIPAVDLLVVEIDRALAIPEYVAVFLNSPLGHHLSTALQTGSSGQQHLNPAHFAFLPVPIKRTTSGSIDWTWQQEIVELVELRATRRRNAESVAVELDAEFIQLVGVEPDLRTIPE